MDNARFNIAAVERETGLSKDVLRMWERRYGFPVPERDQHGERAYSSAQVARLNQIKRLMDQGHRPGKLIQLGDDELARMTPRQKRETPSSCINPDLETLLALVKQHDANGFSQALQHRLIRLGLQQFVLDIVAPLSRRVGEAWEDGYFEVYEEHLFTELTKRVLRQAIAALPSHPGGPRILLTSLPGEQHILGLLMVEALFSLEGADCIPLGTQMPLTEIGRAVEAHRIDIVTLSFSAAFPSRQIPELLQQLRQSLPAQVSLWVGGQGVQRITAPAGVELFANLETGIKSLQNYR